MFTSPGEIAFGVFGLRIHWYGIVMATAICIGLLVVSFIRRKFYSEVSKNFALDLAFYLVLGGIIGARLYYVLLDLTFYGHYPLEAFALWHGGLSIHGAIIGSILVGAIYIKRNGESFLKITDLFTYGLVVGQSIGRWGNFFNSEAFGLPTSLPWKLYISPESRPIEFYNYSYFHPTFLYESLLNICIFLFLFFVVRKVAEGKNGVVFFSYLVLYSMVRYFVESLRVDSVLNVFGMPIAQIVSVVFFIIGICGLILISRKEIAK